MLRRVSLVIFLMLFCAGSAWPKWKPEEQQYLDGQFRAIQEQMQAMKKQIETLAAELTVLRQDHAQAQAAIITQQRQLDDLEKLVASLRIGNEENFSSVKTAITQLREQQEKSFNDLIGRSAQTAAPPAAATVAAPTVRGYVTNVKGDVVTIDVGTAQGVHPGVHLYLFKATDLNVPVGEIEITESVDASTSHARVVSLNPGVRVEFSDVVRPQ